MMIIGAALGESKIREALDIDAFKLTAVRLVVQPLIFLFLFRSLGVSTILWQVAVTLNSNAGGGQHGNHRGDVRKGLCFRGEVRRSLNSRITV